MRFVRFAVGIRAVCGCGLGSCLTDSARIITAYSDPLLGTCYHAVVNYSIYCI